MYHFLETIKVKAGQLQNISFHNDRVNYTRNSLLHTSEKWDLGAMIKVPVLNTTGIYKCRLLYSEAVDSIDFQPYVLPSISKLIITNADHLIYNFKFADRSQLDYLKQKQISNPDEDILIIKDGFVTDTSFSNIVFFDGSTWLTPDTPLLFGTKRAQYLQKGKILKMTIRPTDIVMFKKARLINAMLDLEESPDIQIGDILYR